MLIPWVYQIEDNSGLQESGSRKKDYNLPRTNLAQSEAVMNLLSPLKVQAKVAAPRFCRTAFANPVTSSVFTHTSSQEMKHLNLELQQWFEDLFTFQDPGDYDRRNNEFGSKRNHEALPLSFLLDNLEIILLAGREVTSLSSQPEMAFRAFILNLSSKLAKHQIDVEQRLEILSDLMLLD